MMEIDKKGISEEYSGEYNQESLGSQGRGDADLSRLTPPPAPPDQGLNDFMLMTTRNYREIIKFWL